MNPRDRLEPRNRARAGSTASWKRHEYECVCPHPMRTARLCCTSFGRRSGSGCDAFRAFQRPVHLPVVEVIPRGTPAATPTQFPTIRRCTVPSWEQSLQSSLEPFLTKRAALRSVSSNPARGLGWVARRQGWNIRRTARIINSSVRQEFICGSPAREPPGCATPRCTCNAFSMRLHPSTQVTVS